MPSRKANLDWRHPQDERQHEGQRGRAAETREDPDGEPDRQPDQHQPERGPREDLGQPGQASLDKVGYRRRSRSATPTGTS
jgi:hypothetical protein